MTDERSENRMGERYADVARSVDSLGIKLDSMTQLIDERLKSMEQRMDMTAREQQQSVKLLADAFGKLETKLEHLTSETSEERRLGSVLRTEFDDFRRRIENNQENMRNNIRTLVQVMVGGGLTILASVISIYLTQHH